MQQQTANGSTGLGLNEKTDAQGRVTLATLRPEIEITLVFTKADFLTGHSEAIEGKPGEVFPEETVVMYAETSVTAMIVDADGKPLADQDIRITATYDNRYAQITSKTDPEGRLVVLSELPATEVALHFSTVGARIESTSTLRGAIGPVTLSADAPNDLGSITLSAATP